MQLHSAGGLAGTKQFAAGGTYTIMNADAHDTTDLYDAPPVQDGNFISHAQWMLFVNVRQNHPNDEYSADKPAQFWGPFRLFFWF